jgi:hypothetical protein
MTIRRTLLPALLCAAILAAGAGDASAQVVEGRESEANPASAVFRATLYGTGTGLVLGGAYALVAEDADPGEALRWGTALGAAGGLVVGLVYVATRSDPEGSVDDVGLVQYRAGELGMSPIGLWSSKPRHLPKGVVPALDLTLVGVRF